MPRIRNQIIAMLLLLFPTCALAQMAPPPYAGGTLALSWEQCAPIVADRAAVAGPMTLYASVTNHGLAHRGYQVWLLMGNEYRMLPDAWRFDAAGCNGGHALVTGATPVGLSKACPPFVPAAVTHLEIGQFQLAPPGLGYETTLGSAALAVSYPTGSPNFDPAQRYFLGQFVFDHTNSSFGPTPPGGATCGGLGGQMCIAAIPGKCTWVDADLNEYAFHELTAYALVNNAFLGCFPAVPARATTWGSIKSQYKR